MSVHTFTKSIPRTPKKKVRTAFPHGDLRVNVLQKIRYSNTDNNLSERARINFSRNISKYRKNKNFFRRMPSSSRFSQELSEIRSCSLTQSAAITAIKPFLDSETETLKASLGEIRLSFEFFMSYNEFPR